MVSNEKKADSLKMAIEMSFDLVAKKEVQSKLYQLLMEDTNGTGKLYKYRRFDENGYNLAGLIDGTMYCGRPDEFNDPFDSKLRMSLNDLFEIKLKKDIDLMFSVLNHFMQIAWGIIQIDNCPENEKRIIEQSLQNKEIQSLVKEIHDLKNADKSDINQLASDTIAAFFKLMQIILYDASFSREFNELSKIMPQILEQIDIEQLLSLADKNASLNDYSKAYDINVDTDELSLYTLIAKKINPNNPEIDDFKEKIDGVYRDIVKKINETYFIGCLATDCKNRLMWAHYSDSHKGFCVEYDFSKNCDLGTNHLPYPIIYSSEMPKIPWEAAINNTPENIISEAKQIMFNLLTKDDVWSYEREWRILIDQNNSRNYKMPTITCIYLGAAISEANKKIILEIAKARNIKIKQMQIDRGKYELHAEDIDC